MKKTNNSPLRCAFPKTLQKLAAQIVAQEDYNEEYLLVSMLSATASACGNAVRMCVKGEWKTSPSLYTIIVGTPGQGKSHPLDFAYAPISKRDDELREHFIEKLDQKDNEKKHAATTAASVMERIKVSDFTPEALIQAHDANPRGIAIFVDEIMGMFASINQYSKGQLVEQLLTAYSGNALDVTRVSFERPVHIEHPCINIAGTTQTTRVRELFNRGFLQNGLLDRFMFCYPEDTTLSLWSQKKVKKADVSVAEQWRLILEKIINLPFSKKEEENRMIHFSTAARKKFYDWHDEGVKIIAAGKVNEREQGRMMKTHLHVARTALCIQLLKWACGEGKLDNVDVESVRSAIQISEYFEDCYKRVNVYVSQHSMSPHLQMYIRGLKTTFTTAEAVNLGDDMGMGRRNVMYTLSKLLRLNVIVQIQRGKYRKSDDFKDI